MENPGLVNQQHARAGLYPTTVCVAGLLIQQSTSHVQRDLRSYREADGSFAISDRWPAQNVSRFFQMLAVVQDQVVDALPERGEQLLILNVHGTQNRIITACCTSLVRKSDIYGEMPHPV
jgi:hypothetical protein